MQRRTLKLLEGLSEGDIKALHGVSQCLEEMGAYWGDIASSKTQVMLQVSVLRED